MILEEMLVYYCKARQVHDVFVFEIRILAKFQTWHSRLIIWNSTANDFLYFLNHEVSYTREQMLSKSVGICRFNVKKCQDQHFYTHLHRIDCSLHSLTLH